MTSKFFILILFFIIIGNSQIFAQCEKDISTNPLNPINTEFLLLTNEWDGSNGPYTLNSMLNLWSWYPPSNTPNFNLSLYDGWASDLTGPELTMNNPFFGVGSPTFIHAQANQYQDRDWHWEDGWELLWMNLGVYPDGNESTSLTPGTYYGENSIENYPDPDNVPYFVLYNRYRGTMRVFANVWKTNLVPNSQEFMVTLKFTENSFNSGGLSGILRHIGDFDVALDENSSGRKHFSPRMAPTTKVNWLVTDFQMGFDPCICMREANDSTQLGKLQLIFSDINTTHIAMTSRGISIDQEITQAGLLDDFLNLSDINVGTYEPGQRIYTKMDDLYADYQKRLKKYHDELSEYNSDYNFLNAFLTKVAPALTNTFIDSWSIDDVVSKLKEDSAMATMSDVEVAIELQEQRKKRELNFNSSGDFTTKSLKSLTKGILGVGFDFLSMELFPKTTAPKKPTAPIATFSETVYKGTISDTSYTPGPQMYQPGGVTYTDNNTNGWGYGRADLAFSALPAYNTVLGLVALLNSPKPEFYSKSNIEYDQLYHVEPAFQSDSCYTKNRYIINNEIKLRFANEIKIALNRSLDFNYEATTTYAMIEIETVNSEPRELFMDATISFNSEIINSNFYKSTEKYAYPDYANGGDLTHSFHSKWIPLDNLNQYVFSLERIDTIVNHVFGFFSTYPVPECQYQYMPNYEPEDFLMSIKSVKLKLMHDFYFQQIGSRGEKINTSQVFTYLLYDGNQNINLLGPESTWVDNQPDIFNEYMPGLLELYNENITINSEYVSQVIGNIIYINAEEVLISGDITVENGYTVVIQALNTIDLKPNAHLVPNIHLKIKKDFYDTPVFEYIDNSEVYNFCNNSNDYHANAASKSAYQRIKDTNVLNQESKNGANFEKNSVSIHPNPANSQIRITSSSKPITEIQLFDLSGRSLIHKKTGNDIQQVEMNIDQLQSGVYIVQTVCGDERSSEKLVVGK